MITGESSTKTEMADSVGTGKQKPLHLGTTAEKENCHKKFQPTQPTTNQHQFLVKIRRRTVNSIINSLWYGREPN